MLSAYEDLTRQARALEMEVDMKLSGFSKACAGNDYSRGRGGVSEPLLPKEHLVESTSVEIKELLKKLSAINEKLENSVTPKDLNPIQIHTQQRHREILEDYTADFNRTYDNFKLQRQKEELMSSVQKDIDSYKSGLNRRTELYLRENEHLLSSDRLIDDQINIAVETREHLLSQRLSMKRLQTRLHDVASRFPVVNSLVQRINLRKRRDSIILGIIVFICTILLLSYAFH